MCGEGRSREVRYVTYYDSVSGGLADVDIHPDKESAVKFYRREAKHYFYGLQLPSKTVPPTACGYVHRLFGIMSIRKFRKSFPEWKGGAK